MTLSRALILLALPAVAAAAPDPAAGRTVATAWKHGARAAISITMDDGYASQSRFMAPLLTSRGFSGTFFIVTGWVEREDLWPRWREVAEAGHEIGSHGVTHAPLDGLSPEALREELEASRRLIRERLGEEHGRTLAYPQSTASPGLAEAAARAGYDAARTGGIAYAPATPGDFHRIPSMHPVRTTPLWEMNSWVDDILEKEGWLVVGVHGIDEPDRDAPETQQGWEPVPAERYVAFVDHIAAARDRLWVAPFGEVARYIKARRAARAATRRVETGRIDVFVDGPPGGPELTFETEVPGGWVEVEVRVGRGPGIIHPTRRSGQGRAVRYLAAPPADVRLVAAALSVHGERPAPGNP